MSADPRIEQRDPTAPSSKTSVEPSALWSNAGQLSLGIGIGVGMRVKDLELMGEGLPIALVEKPSAAVIIYRKIQP